MQNDFDLESMRQQMTVLKNKLNEQEIVNDRLVRRSMRKEVNNITRRNYILFALCLLLIPYSYWCFVKLSEFSLAFWIGTSVLMLICAGAIFYNTRRISEASLMSHSLVETRRKVVSAKKFDRDWFLIGIPMIILWLSWFGYEVYKKCGSEEVTTFFWAGLVGAVIGTIIGLSLQFKTQHQYQEIIEQIEDLTRGEE